MGITLVTNLSNVLAGKTVRTGTSKMIRIAANMVNLFESHVANKVLNMHADSEEDMQEIENLRQEMEATTDEKTKEKLQKRIDKKEGKLETLVEKTASYNDLLINPLDLSMTSEEIMSANNMGDVPTEPITEPIAESIVEPLAQETVEVPEVGSDLETVSESMGETISESTSEAVQPDEIISESIPEVAQIDETMAAPLTDNDGIIYDGVPQESTEPIETGAIDLNTWESPEAVSETEKVIEEDNPVEAILEQNTSSNDLLTDGLENQVGTIEENSSDLEIPEPIDFNTIGEDVTMPVEETKEQTEPLNDWSTLENVFPTAEMHSTETVQPEPALVPESSIVDEMFNPYYQNSNSEISTKDETEGLLDNAPESSVIEQEPVETSVVNEEVPLAENMPELSSDEKVEAQEVDTSKQYEDELSRRLTFVYGDNYENEIGKEENADRVQKIENAVSNDIELERQVKAKVEDYKEQLLTKGFEEDSAEMLYLLGSKREIAEHELMYPNEKAELIELNQNLASEENSRKEAIDQNREKISHAKHSKENMELALQEDDMLDNELNADAELTIVGEETPSLGIDEDSDKDKVIEELKEQLAESTKREKETQEQIKELSNEMKDLKRLIQNMVQVSEPVYENEQTVSKTR